MRKTLSALALDLESGRTSSRELVEDALERISDPEGEGRYAFVRVDNDAALDAADAMDAARRAGVAPSFLAGVPVSVKDIFDVAGQVTKAGSVVLENAGPAGMDASAIARLRAAGLVVIGRTNMTEFAYSGLGINPHFGTPANPYDRNARRIPGGSSSGAAVSVTDGMAGAAIGTDTGGSCRIPAALCGVVGYKPTSSTISREGVLPLSKSLDSIGSLANSVECCRLLHGIMCGFAVGPESLAVQRERPVKGLRIAVPQSVVLDGMDAHVATVFERSLNRLSRAGANVTEIPLAAFSEVAGINEKGGLVAAEAYAWHRPLLDQHADRYDPRVLVRILKGRTQDAVDYISTLRAREGFVQKVSEEIADFDAIAMPTVPIIAPAIASLEQDDTLYSKANLAMLRNPALINMMDGCAISLPINRGDEAPAGLMLAAAANQDHRLFAVAAAVEKLFQETLAAAV